MSTPTAQGHTGTILFLTHLFDLAFINVSKVLLRATGDPMTQDRHYSDHPSHYVSPRTGIFQIEPGLAVYYPLDHRWDAVIEIQPKIHSLFLHKSLYWSLYYTGSRPNVTPVSGHDTTLVDHLRKI